MAKSKEISATMALALAAAHDHAGLIRYVGGYWSWRNAPRGHNGNPVEYFGTSTIDGLVKRGRLKYTEWKAGRGGEFPIAVELIGEPDEIGDPRTPQFGVAS